MNARNRNPRSKGAYVKMNRIGIALLSALVVLLGGCNDILDLPNPNGPTAATAVTSVDGVIALAVGMQDQFAQAQEDFLVPNSLVTDEWGTDRKSLISYQSLFSGQNLDASYGVIRDPYFNTYRVVRTANTVLASAGSVGMGPGLQAGVTSLAKLFKAMALGQAIQLYEKVPVDVAIEGGVLQTRAVVLDTVISLLESARADVANVADADLAGFRTRVVPSTFDLRNTIDAMLARYYLMDGQYQQAITAANRVSLTVVSQLSFPSPTINPIYNLTSTARLNYIGGLRSFATEAEAGDQRPAYWLDLTTQHTGTPDSLIYTLRRYTLVNDPVPLYLPDEMQLIKAEALARTGDLTQAISLINGVRTQTTGRNTFDPAAGLPALTAVTLNTLDAVLRQIAYERRYELYMQGTRWEDIRRLPQPWVHTITLPYLPLPQGECLTNRNVTC
jgi:starch-binding outer membrane protein, SusD/RagB family